MMWIAKGSLKWPLLPAGFAFCSMICRCSGRHRRRGPFRRGWKLRLPDQRVLLLMIIIVNSWNSSITIIEVLMMMVGGVRT
jgi:hypothetical protein